MAAWVLLRRVATMLAELRRRVVEVKLGLATLLPLRVHVPAAPQAAPAVRQADLAALVGPQAASVPVGGSSCRRTCKACMPALPAWIVRLSLQHSSPVASVPGCGYWHP